MKKSKKTTRVALLPHQTSLPDKQRLACTEKYTRLGQSFLMHKVILSLPANAFKVLLYMLHAAGSWPSFKIFPSHIPGMSKTTFYQSVQVLESCKIIKVVRLRMPGCTNNYQFTGKWAEMISWDDIKANTTIT